MLNKRLLVTGCWDVEFKWKFYIRILNGQLLVAGYWKFDFGWNFSR
jgi:hypothetical protein